MKRKETACVTEQLQLAEGIYSLRLRVSFADAVKPGQFVSLFTGDPSRLLPRPLSVCGADPAAGEIRVVYRVAGSGTKDFSGLVKGDKVDVMGPLGNGFPLEETAGKRVLLAGGGIGIPPMLFCGEMLADEERKEKPASVTFAAGYRSADTFLLEEMKAAAPVLISTDDGSLGVHGTVLDAVRASGAEADVIFACGPKVMLRAVKDFARETGAACYVSLEERMACGVGVCLGCVAKTTGIDSHSHVGNTRICADGPVFAAEEVDLT
jgi:dihydroorotate dehydrogenase electron transfer subunit